MLERGWGLTYFVENFSLPNTTGAAHLPYRMHTELGSTNIHCRHAQLGGHYWTNCTSTCRVVSDYKILHGKQETRYIHERNSEFLFAYTAQDPIQVHDNKLVNLLSKWHVHKIIQSLLEKHPAPTAYMSLSINPPGKLQVYWPERSPVILHFMLTVYLILYFLKSAALKTSLETWYLRGQE